MDQLNGSVLIVNNDAGLAMCELVKQFSHTVSIQRDNRVH